MADRNKHWKELIELLQRKLSQLGYRFIVKGRPGEISHSLEDSQTIALYSEIQSFNYFDEPWYRLAYKNEIEFPDDLLLDYIRAGIPNGRDPSSYLNTILYFREHKLPQKKPCSIFFAVDGYQPPALIAMNKPYWTHNRLSRPPPKPR